MLIFQFIGLECFFFFLRHVPKQRQPLFFFFHTKCHFQEKESDIPVLFFQSICGWVVLCCTALARPSLNEPFVT